MCKFVQDLAEQPIRRLTVSDVFDGSVRMSFINRASWLESQRECPDLRKVHTYLSSGVRPRKKENKMRDVKTYLQRVVIASDGLLVVRDIMPFDVSCERIVVPRKFIQGLLTAIHLRFGHPTASQLKQIVRRYFYAINLDSSVESVSGACDICNSLKFVPQSLCVQSSSEPPLAVGTSFAFDVLRRERQLIAVLRETVTSYSATAFIGSESHSDHRDSLLILTAEMKGRSSEIRIDPAPGLAVLKNDTILKEHGVILNVGREKNINKNPVAERAVQELEEELLKLQPDKGPVSKVTLALATAAMNSRIRREGLSSRELWTQRDQFTGNQFPVDDQLLIQNQTTARERNHKPSAQSKFRPSTRKVPSGIAVGDLLYLVNERSKLQAREKYLVTSIQNSCCSLRKFTRQQFRKKEYHDVPLNEVYPIVNHPLTTPPPPEESSSDSDCDVFHQETQELQEEIDTGGNVEEPESSSGSSLRPRRNTKAPSWHNDYDMSH